VLQVANKLYLKEEELKNKIQEFTVQNNAVNWRDFKINSDEEWRKFLIVFQKEHPEFIFYIKSKFSSITAGEIRLLCLTRLGLDDIAIASILSVNVNSISQTRRRFMRKLGIESLKELKGLIFSI
jgi:DNA-binding CsgD family transcriptional regulator